jgi:hypothetical protein
MNNISINDNWCISVLIVIIIIFLLIKIYDSLGNSDISSPIIVTQALS